MQAGGVKFAPCAYRLIRDIAQLSQKPVLQLLPESIKTSLQRCCIHDLEILHATNRVEIDHLDISKLNFITMIGAFVVALFEVVKKAHSTIS